MDSLFLGAIISISSTTIIMTSPGRAGLRGERFAGMVFVSSSWKTSWASCSSPCSRESPDRHLAILGCGADHRQLAVFLIVSLVLGLIAVPRLVGFVARFRSQEMLLVTVLGLCCFGFCLLTVNLGSAWRWGPPDRGHPGGSQGDRQDRGSE